MAKKRWKTGLLIFFAILLLLQLIPTDQNNLDSDPALDYIQQTQAPTAISTMLKEACYDCHSHHTVYPWYTNIQPVGWWLKGHVKHGMEHLNFSIWGEYPTKKANHKLEECVEVLEEHRMPLKSYTWLHPKAKLSSAQQAELIAWFKKSLE